MEQQHTTYIDSPAGQLRIRSTAVYITEVHFLTTAESGLQITSIAPDAPEVLQQCVRELAAYFAGQLTVFTVPVHQQGTAFQQKVWSELLTIAYGKTISYLQLSKQLGDPKAIRAAAATNGKNNIAIIVPCHRVIGSNNDLVGYAGGLSRKRWLLEHEAKYTYGVQTLF
jgi:methylated-DNA-[protein]-cysteine S-methyltransferase